MPDQSSSQARRHQADLLVKTAAPAVAPIEQLRAAFEQLGPVCTEKIAPFAPVPMMLDFRDLACCSMTDAIAGYGHAAVVGTFKMPERRSLFVIGADGEFMDSALEAVFGSDGSEPAGEGQRAATRIGMRLAAAIFDQVADALRLSVFGAGAGPLESEGLETAEKLPATTRPDEPSVIAKFGLSALERGGEMFIVLPQPTMQAVQQPSAASAAAATTAGDARWSRRIEQEVQRTQVTLQAVLDERELTLGDIADLRVGQVLPLKATPRSNVKVVCNDQTLFWCELGQAEGVYTLRIKDFPDAEQELIDVIASQ